MVDTAEDTPGSVVVDVARSVYLLMVTTWLALLSVSVRATLALGHWPAPTGADDPKDLDLRVHYELSGWAFLLLLLSSLVLGERLDAWCQWRNTSWIKRERGAG